MTIILEYRKVTGKHLLIKFLFNSNIDALDDGRIYYSLDKYMSLDIWSRLYEKITKSIDRYVSNEKNKPASETIGMHRAQLDLHISWRKMNAEHSVVVDTMPDTIYTYFMVVDVRAVSKINEFIKKSSKSVSASNGRVDSFEDENSTQSTSTSTSNGKAIKNGEATTSKRSHEEYVPAATKASPKSSKLKYTPSKSTEMDADEYTPIKLFPVQANHHETDKTGTDMQHYFPSPLNNNNQSKFSRSQNKSPRPNKIRAPIKMVDWLTRSEQKPLHSADAMPSEKLNMDQDLFGDSPESNAQDVDKKAKPTTVVSTRSNHERKAKMVTQKSFPPKSTSSNASSTSHASKRFKTQEKSIKTKIDDKEKKEMNIVHNKIRQKIRDNTLTNLEGEAIDLQRLIDLKDLSPTAIANTFDEHSVALTKIFNEKKMESRLQRPTDYNYLTVTCILIENEHQYAMVDKLTEKFTKMEDHGPLPYPMLFWEFMVPEWALLIFMKRYNLTRPEALKQVKNHDNAVTLNSIINFDSI